MPGARWVFPMCVPGISVEADAVSARRIYSASLVSAGGKGVFPEAGRVSSPRQEGCLPRGRKGVFPEAGRVSSPRQEECLPRCGEGVYPDAGRVSTPRRGGYLPRFVGANNHSPLREEGYPERPVGPPDDSPGRNPGRWRNPGRRCETPSGGAPTGFPIIGP